MSLISDRFKEFLSTYPEGADPPKYKKIINQLYCEGLYSLEVNYDDIIDFDYDFAVALTANPKRYLPEINMGFEEYCRDTNDYKGKRTEIFNVRFDNLVKCDKEDIKDIRAKHINKLIQLEGTIRFISEVKPEVREAVFQCQRCSDYMTIIQDGEILKEPIVCDNPECGRNGPFKLIEESSSFSDWQGLKIQEKLEKLRGGQMPRDIDCVARGDLVEKALAGAVIRVVGVLKIYQEKGKMGKKTTYSKIFEINNLKVMSKQPEELEATDDDIEEFLDLARDPNVCTMIRDSIAPAIFGALEVKEAIALMLFAGDQKLLSDGTKLRGSSNILLVGDPGIAKSQVLKFVNNVAPRSIYTSGKGTSAAGLTAAVIKDELTGGFGLEAGALVIADEGIACIEENQEVITIKGKVKIKDIKEGDLIINYKDGNKGIDLVKSKYYKGQKEVIKVKTESGKEIIATPDHIVMTTNGWKELREIKDEEIITLNQFLSVWEHTRIISRESHGKKKVYDLSINNTPNFIVNDIIVHNCIDEIDKMSKDDRSSVHEAMEQQSYHSSLELIIDNERVKIGKYIDKLMIQNEKRVVNGINCQILEVQGKKIMSTDFKNITQENITNVSRHIAPKEFIKITYSNGREIVVTPEHPIYIYEKDGIATTEAKNISVGKLVPLTNNISITSGKVVKVDLIPNETEKYVYDVTVEPHHTFIAEGIILHNTISIAKAGIMATLNARASILAAANPKRGRFDRHKPLVDQIELEPTLLSRFDLIFIMTDTPTEQQDRLLANHIQKMWNNATDAINPPLGIDTLRKYIAYATKEFKHITLTEEAQQSLNDYYVDLRKPSAEGGEKPIPITARQLESLRRLVESRARMRLSHNATIEDSEKILKLYKYTMENVAKDTETGEIDIDMIMSGTPKSQRDKITVIMDIISSLDKKNNGEGALQEEVYEDARAENISDSFTRKIIDELKQKGDVYEPRPDRLKLTLL